MLQVLVTLVLRWLLVFGVFCETSVAGEFWVYGGLVLSSILLDWLRVWITSLRWCC